MDRAQSPTAATGGPRSLTGDSPRKLLLVVGCQRSGTTWLQLLLAQHPGVATCNETFLFVYIHYLNAFWTSESNRSPARRRVGLSRVISADEFYGLCRDFAAGVVEKIARSRPDAQIVLEKSPDHLLHWELIVKLFPDAYFLHVIRDPRSVVASLRAASRSAWGAAWAPRTVIAAVERWRMAIEAGRRLAATRHRYREVRYESLVTDGPGQLRQILAWLGLPFEERFPEHAVAACRIDNLRTASTDTSAPWAIRQEPPGFFRRGEPASWREELSPADVRVVEYLARDLMRDLGYAPISPRPGAKPIALHARDVLDAIRWRSRQWLERLGA